MLNKEFTVKAKVDRRVELVSIVARLAEYPEYQRDDFKSYAEDVDTYFGKYKKHPAIEFAKEVRRSNYVAFDAVQSMAVHLKSDLTPKFTFSDSSPDNRWGKANAEKFAVLLQKFCKDADCNKFFQNHSDLYKIAEQRFQKILDKVDFEWYRKFYGEMPKGDFNLYTGLIIGPMNFGPKVVYPDGREEINAIIGIYEMDENDLPVYTDRFLPTIIHEFNHGFINHLVDERIENFSQSGENVFQPVRERMGRSGYGIWKAMIIESLVRAGVARYALDHEGGETVGERINIEQRGGFLWMDELVALLGAYDNNRKTYPTLRSFMPMIEAYYADLSKRIDEINENYEKLRPKVIAIEEFENNSQNVDAQLKQITFVFDRPMDPAEYSIMRTAGQDKYPVGDTVKFSEDGKKLEVAVSLEPDKEYEFVLTYGKFKSADGFALQDYFVKFKTKE